MKYTKYIFAIIFSTICLWSCEDVVEVPLENSEASIVVDAWLNNLAEDQSIRITKSQPYFDNNFSSGLVGAEVTVIKNETEIFEFIDEGEGDYVLSTDEPIGIDGDEFKLEIIAEGKNLSAVATMNAAPVIDSITYEVRDELFEEGIYCNFFSRDLEGTGDTYWIKTYKNNVYLSKPIEINIAYDAGFDAGFETDGVVFITPIREAMNPIADSMATGISPWEFGDLARVEIHSMNEEVFYFMESVRDQLLNSLNTIFAEPLVNPRGNIINNTDEDIILGAFNVGEISSLEFLIEE